MFKKNGIIKRRSITIKKFDYKNLIFLVLFFCGFIIGVLTIKNDSSIVKDIFSELFSEYMYHKTNDSFFNCFLDSVLVIISPVVLAFVFGLCAVGTPIVIAIPTVTGIVVGMAIGFLYFNYSLQGLGYAALILIPCLSIVIATLLKCCGESVKMSIDIIAGISGYQNQGKRNELKEYSLKFLIFSIPLILSALLNICSFKLFGGLFSFV